MKTLLLFLSLTLLAVPAQAQRVFRASSIDLEQNDRLDVLEAKVSSIENSINRLAVAIEAATMDKVVVAEKPVPAPAKPVVVPTPAPTPTVVYSQPTTVTYAPQRQVVSTASGYYDGTSQWTYPGDIRSHLTSTHGVSTAGMSKDQMEALHDSLHNSSSGRSVSRSVTRSVQTQSACPGGVCPSPASRSTVRRGIFGWRR